MSAYWTQHTAFVCAHRMWLDNYTPATIIDIGVGGGWPERAIWLWLYPTTKIIGADPRGRRSYDTGKIRFFKGLISDKDNDAVSFCWSCRSTKCSREHDSYKRLENRVLTLDALTGNAPPPYFLWVDVEGGEMEVLRGGENTLLKTRWINMEACNYGALSNHVNDIQRWMQQHGYSLVLKHQNTYDQLYRKQDNL